MVTFANAPSAGGSSETPKPVNGPLLQLSYRLGLCHGQALQLQAMIRRLDLGNLPVDPIRDNQIRFLLSHMVDMEAVLLSMQSGVVKMMDSSTE